MTIGEVISPAPVVQIRDARGNDVATGGVEVTVGRSSGPGTLEGTLTVTTDASGKAQFPDLKITGKSGTHRLIFAADGFKSATSSKFEVTKRATSTTITGVNPEPSEIAQAVTVSFTVGFGAGSPTGNVRVSASTGESCPSSRRRPGAMSDPFLTPGVRTLTAEYQTTDQFAASTSNGVQHTVNAALPPPNNPPLAAFDPPVCTVGVPCQFSDGSSDSDGTVEGWLGTLAAVSPRTVKIRSIPSIRLAMSQSVLPSLTMTAPRAHVSHTVTCNDLIATEQFEPASWH